MERNYNLVKHYQYLGHMVTNDGRCETEVKRRIGMAKSTFNDMRKIVTSKQITNKLNMRIIKCNIYSILMYGSET